MPKFLIKYGLSGGFNAAANDWEEIEVDDLEGALLYAFHYAVEEYESLEGMHGIRCVEDIMEEDGLSEEDAEEEYYEERDSWLYYVAKPVEE